MKKCIYTCLVGNYDELKQPAVTDASFDYICFSNDIFEENIGIWQIRKIPFENPDKTRLSRYVKFFPHKVLSEYEYSVWMDANLLILTEDFYKAIEKQIERKTLIAQVPHIIPPIDCIYDEIKYAFRLTRVRFTEARKQYKHLKEAGFPTHFGLFENNIIARFHNNEMVKKISEEWWTEYMSFSKRDQFSLMFIYWKNDFMPSFIFGPNENSWNSKCVKYIPHTRILSKITLTTISKSLKKNSIKYIKLFVNRFLVYFIR